MVVAVEVVELVNGEGGMNGGVCWWSCDGGTTVPVVLPVVVTVELESVLRLSAIVRGDVKVMPEVVVVRGTVVVITVVGRPLFVADVVTVERSVDVNGAVETVETVMVTDHGVDVVDVGGRSSWVDETLDVSSDTSCALFVCRLVRRQIPPRLPVYPRPAANHVA